MLNLVSSFRHRRPMGEETYLAEMPSSRYSFVFLFEVKSASRRVTTSRNAVAMGWARWRYERNRYVSRVWGVRPIAHWVGGFTLKRNFPHLCGRPPNPPRSWTSDLLKLLLNILLCILSTLSEFVEPRRIKVQTTRSDCMGFYCEVLRLWSSGSRRCEHLLRPVKPSALLSKRWV
jgi:hypothetical protein